VHRYQHRIWAATACVFLLFSSGCRRHAGGNDGLPTASAHAGVRRYPLHGIVLGKSTLSHEVTIRQEAIRGFMPTTNAVYMIRNADTFRQLKPGDQITADVLVPPDSNNYRLEKVAITAESRDAGVLATLPPHQLLIGEQVPDIPLVNQDGKTIRLPQYRGKAVLITFIDTQCTEDCPIISGLFGKVNAALSSQDPSAYADSRLISISLDPKFDTPPVLRKYGLGYLHGNAGAFSHWEFADLTAANLQKLAAAFGVIYAPSHDGDIVHTMQTALIGPDNTVIQMWGGDDWNPKVIAKAVEAATEKKASS
jgi:protein SCO1